MEQTTALDGPSKNLKRNYKIKKASLQDFLGLAIVDSKNENTIDCKKYLEKQSMNLDSQDMT